MRRVAIIILAAGESRRLGEPKQLLQFRGKTLLRHAIDTGVASGCCSVVVVLGANAERLRQEVPQNVRCVENARWGEGMGSSIDAGVSALGDDAEAALVMLCDQPLITAEILDRFITAEADLVAAEYNDTIGVPALFGRKYFPELLALEGGSGAKQILLRHTDRLVKIACPESAVDIDTAEDLQRLRAVE